MNETSLCSASDQAVTWISLTQWETWHSNNTTRTFLGTPWTWISEEFHSQMCHLSEIQRDTFQFASGPQAMSVSTLQVPCSLKPRILKVQITNQRKSIFGRLHVRRLEHLELASGLCVVKHFYWLFEDSWDEREFQLLCIQTTLRPLQCKSSSWKV